MNQKEYYNILVIGNSFEVSGLIRRYVYGSYKPNERLLTAFLKKNILIDGQILQFKIWENSKSAIKLYLNSFDGIIVIFNTSETNALEDVKYYFNEMRKNAKNDLDVILIGNQSHSTREISKEKAENFAYENNLHYFDVSIPENEGIDEAFSYIATQIHHHYIYKNSTKNFKVSIK